jgi:hypothetical protein
LIEVRDVLVIHGLWMTGAETSVLRSRLSEQGYAARAFCYQSIHAAPGDILDALEVVIMASQRGVHVIGHSLGGLLIMRLLERNPALPIGRVVLLGAPVNGCVAAETFARLPGAQSLFGLLAEGALFYVASPNVVHPVDIGVIAGNAGFAGVPFLFPAEPNDGAVLVRETLLRGAKAHRVLGLSHMGLLLSTQVAELTGVFLSSGFFPE